MTMEKTKVDEFLAHYQRLEEWEIAGLHDRASSLTEEARTAIGDRGIDLEKIRHAAAKEEAEYAAKERARVIKKEKREALLLKIFFVMTALAIVFRPSQAYKNVSFNLGGGGWSSGYCVGCTGD
jgi:hypothetical protein